MKKLLMVLVWTSIWPSFGDSPNIEISPSIENVKEKLSVNSQEHFLMELARRGDLESMKSLADSYYFGRDKNIPQSMAKAFYWYSQLAAKDIPAGLNNLGFMLKNGLGCEKNYEKAAQAFKAAIDSPLSTSMPCDITLLNLSALYYGGKGVEKNKVKAFELFEQFMKKFPEHLFTLNFLEVIERDGNVIPLILENLKGYENSLKRDKSVCPSLLEFEKGFAYFTHFLDQGESQENKILQFIADHSCRDIGHYFNYTTLKEIYLILGKPLPQG